MWMQIFRMEDVKIVLPRLPELSKLPLVGGRVLRFKKRSNRNGSNGLLIGGKLSTLSSLCTVSISVA